MNVKVYLLVIIGIFDKFHMTATMISFMGIRYLLRLIDFIFAEFRGNCALFSAYQFTICAIMTDLVEGLLVFKKYSLHYYYNININNIFYILISIRNNFYFYLLSFI